MKKSQRILRWGLLLWKRLYKKLTFVLLLAIIPVLVCSYGVASEEESGMAIIALASEGETVDSLTATVWEDLRGSEVILYIICDSPQQARQMVADGDANAAWIFAEDLETKIYDFVAYRDRGHAFITVVEPKDRVMLTLVREMLSGVMFPYCSETLYLQYLRETAPELDDVSDETLLEYYESVDFTDGLFVFTDTEGNIKDPEENQSYLMAPVRGMLAVVTVLAGLATAMYYIRDEKSGTFDCMPQRSRPLVEFGCQMISIVNILLVVMVSLALTGQIRVWGLELLVAGIYGLCVAVFAMTVRRLSVGIRGLGMVTPILVVVMLVVCPVFFDLGPLRRIQLLLPPTYFVNGVYNEKYVLLMAVYTLILLAICRIIDRIRHVV